MSLGFDPNDYRSAGIPAEPGTRPSCNPDRGGSPALPFADRQLMIVALSSLGEACRNASEVIGRGLSSLGPAPHDANTSSALRQLIEELRDLLAPFHDFFSNLLKGGCMARLEGDTQPTQEEVQAALRPLRLILGEPGTQSPFKTDEPASPTPCDGQPPTGEDLTALKDLKALLDALNVEIVKTMSPGE